LTLKLPQIPRELIYLVAGLILLASLGSCLDTNRRLARAEARLRVADSTASVATSRAIEANLKLAEALAENVTLLEQVAKAETAAQKAHQKALLARQRLAALTPAPDTCQPHLVELEAAYDAQTERADSLGSALLALGLAYDSLASAAVPALAASEDLTEAVPELSDAASEVAKAARPGWLKRLLPQKYVGVELGYDLLNNQPALTVGIGIGWGF
jgi:chromosome segregation ATPase